jgi:hypothetical protein
MSQQNKSTLQSAINTQLADNITGDISAADVRDNLINMTDSLLFNTGSAQSITGSLIITEGITGSLQGTATTASYVLNAVSASHVLTASYVETAQTASYVVTAQTASFVVTAQTASFVVTAQTASYVVTAQTASYVVTAQTASYVLNAVSASHVLTASYVNPLNQEVILTGNITASGDIRLTTAGNAVVRPIIDLTPNGIATFNPNTTTTTAYANYGINVITTATATDYCLRLPQTPVEGKSVTIVNNSGINVVLFPSVIGGGINGVIDGVEIIPSDGKSYTFDCYENPLPGGWSLSTSPSTGNTSISTGVINWNYGATNSASIAYVNDSIKGLGGGTTNSNVYDGLNINPLYAGDAYSWTWGGNTYSYAYSKITPDTIPGVGVWQSINSIQISTNLTSSLANSFYSSFGISMGKEVYYNNSTTLVWTPQAFYDQQEWIDFNTNVVNPWHAAHPGTALWNYSSNSGYYVPHSVNIVPGVFTASIASPYTSNNVGDPGTVTFILNNIPAYVYDMGLRMIGRSLIGSVYTPLEGLTDVWYSQILSPYLSAYSGTPFIPNIKFNTTFNVQI